ncbi:hypothetical protein ACHAWF_008995, partial [Thalassiosira exigua]
CHCPHCRRRQHIGIGGDDDGGADLTRRPSPPSLEHRASIPPSSFLNVRVSRFFHHGGAGGPPEALRVLGDVQQGRPARLVGTLRGTARGRRRRPHVRGRDRPPGKRLGSTHRRSRGPVEGAAGRVARSDGRSGRRGGRDDRGCLLLLRGTIQEGASGGGGRADGAGRQAEEEEGGGRRGRGGGGRRGVVRGRRRRTEATGPVGRG